MIYAASDFTSHVSFALRADDAALRKLIDSPVMQSFVDNAARHRLEIPVKHLNAFDYLVSFCGGCNAHQAAIDCNIPTSEAIKNIRRLGVLGVDATLALLKRNTGQKAATADRYEHRNADRTASATRIAPAEPNISARVSAGTCRLQENTTPTPSPCPQVPFEIALPTASTLVNAPILLSPGSAEADCARHHFFPSEGTLWPELQQWPSQGQISHLYDACTTHGSGASIGSHPSPMAPNLMMTLAVSAEPDAATSSFTSEAVNIELRNPAWF